MMKHIASAAVLDDQIRDAELLIAELVRQIADVTLEQQGLGNTVRSAETTATTAPFRQHIAELKAHVSAWKAARTRHMYALLARASGIETPEPELDLDVVDLGEIEAKYEDAESEAMDDTLLAALEESVAAEAEKRAAKANKRNETRAKAAKRAQRADDCIGAGCEHCAEHARPELPAPGTPERAALDTDVERRMSLPTKTTED